MSMLMQLLLQILDWGFGLLTMSLLARLLMQWARVPFRNPLGQFVMAVTDWAVIPARRLIPSVTGFDLPTLLLAWLVQAMHLGVLLGLGLGLIMYQGVLLELMSAMGLAPTGFLTVAILAILTILGVINYGLYLIMGVVIVSALFSWFNPHAPLAPLLNMLSRPFLTPLQRVIPPLGGVDFTPMVLLLILQVLLAVLEQTQHYLLPAMLMQ